MVLKIGDSAPNFDFMLENKLTDLHSIGGLKIVYFFPKAFTPACTKESCSIRDYYDTLKEKGISEVIGISTDSSDTQQKFKNKYDLPFPLIADPKKRISKDFKVFKNFLFYGYSKRITFLIDEGNKIVSVKNLGLRAGNTKYGIKNYGQELLELIQIEN